LRYLGDQFGVVPAQPFRRGSPETNSTRQSWRIFVQPRIRIIPSCPYGASAFRRRAAGRSSNFDGPEHALAINLFTNDLPGEFLGSAVTYCNFSISKMTVLPLARAFKNQRRGWGPFRSIVLTVSPR